MIIIMVIFVIIIVIIVILSNVIISSSSSSNSSSSSISIIIVNIIIVIIITIISIIISISITILMAGSSNSIDLLDVTFYTQPGGRVIVVHAVWLQPLTVPLFKSRIKSMKIIKNICVFFVDAHVKLIA
jgi:hypothetical protein